MRVGILGPLEMVGDRGAVEVGGARLRALLVRLALDAGRTVTAESLSSAVWPDGGPDERANALQTLVSRLRRALPPEVALRAAGGGYRLDLPPEAVDAVRFERLAREGRRALTAGDPAGAARMLRSALALWRGPALADLAEAPSAAAPAVRLEELRLAAAEDRITADLALLPPADLVAEIRQLVAAHPLRERLRTLLVRALHGDGRPAEALTVYEDYRALVADELGSDPGPELREAHLAVLRGQEPPRAGPAGARPAPRLRGNLRAALTSFVGRTEERARIGKQLGEGRLVTLVGPGGAGKSRLAAAVAAATAGDPGEPAGELAGGVWLVELAPVSDPGEVPQAVVDALGLRGTGVPEAPTAPADPTSRLVDALSATPTLLVLDNCEHLLDPVARLVDELLGRCPALRILATSREPLRILGEALCPVPPLRLPEPGAPDSDAVASPAVRLFADRAAAVRPDFAVTAANAATVVEICRRLDGLPLAIELAAARLRSLTLEQVAARLDDRFRLLTGGSRAAVPRHRTLHAVVAWSWDLLDEDERTLARRLAVFPATITPEAAGQVCAPAPAGPDQLAALVDKSLLQLREDPQPRYRMLETIREYGWQKLAEAGEVDRTRAAYAAYCLDLADRAAPRLRTADQLPWLARLHAEQGGAAAFGIAHDAGEADTAVRLAAGLSYYWTIQGDHAGAARRLRTALEMPGRAAPQARTVVAAAYLFNAVLSAGDPEAQVATDLVGDMVCDPGPAGFPAGPEAALVAAGLALIGYDARSGLAATDPWLSHPDPCTRATLWLMRSWLYGNDGDMDAMRHCLAISVEAFREAGERWGLATALTHRAHTQITLGDFDAAIAGLEEATGLLRELDPGHAAVHQRVLLAGARAQRGDREQARRQLREILEPGDRLASARHLVFARISLGDLARLDGDLAEAARQYDAATGDLDSLAGASLFQAMLLCGMGHLALEQGQRETARRRLADALALAVDAPDMPIVADVAVAVARLPWHDAAAETAAQVLGAAHTLRGAPDAFDPDVVALTGQLRTALGERAFQAAYGRGRGLDRSGALAQIEDQARRR